MRAQRDGDEVAELSLVPPKDGYRAEAGVGGFSGCICTLEETQHERFVLNARQMSVVDQAGVRAVRPGTYGLALGGAQPGDAAGLSGQFTVSGTKELPR